MPAYQLCLVFSGDLSEDWLGNEKELCRKNVKTKDILKALEGDEKLIVKG